MSRRVVAYPEDRARLLKSREMAMPVYTSAPEYDAVQEIYRAMVASAARMDLALTEPVVESGRKDYAGGRIVTVRAGVFESEPA